MGLEGARSVAQEPGGALILSTDAGPLRMERPHIYQDTEAGRREIKGAFVRLDDERIGFSVEAYDKTATLVDRPRPDLLDLLQRLGQRLACRARRFRQHLCRGRRARASRPTAGNGRGTAGRLRSGRYEARPGGHDSPFHDLYRGVRQRKPGRPRGVRRADPRGGLHELHGFPDVDLRAAQLRRWGVRRFCPRARRGGRKPRLLDLSWGRGRRLRERPGRRFPGGGLSRRRHRIDELPDPGVLPRATGVPARPQGHPFRRLRRLRHQAVAGGLARVLDLLSVAVGATMQGRWRSTPRATLTSAEVQARRICRWST